VSVKAQIIEANGKPEYAVIPYRDYLRLVEAEEDAEDLRAAQEFEHKLASGEEELLPAEMVHRLVEGENAILVWREYRGLTQVQLAKAAGVGQSYIAMLERGKRQGTAARLRAIARALKVQMDDLLTASFDIRR
jgi:DNA-binding XRE family transcriptional regulator